MNYLTYLPLIYYTVTPLILYSRITACIFTSKHDLHFRFTGIKTVVPDCFIRFTGFTKWYTATSPGSLGVHCGTRQPHSICQINRILPDYFVTVHRIFINGDTDIFIRFTGYTRWYATTSKALVDKHNGTRLLHTV
jgi:hypothetical protein